MTDRTVNPMLQEALVELRDYILPYWMSRMPDYAGGGFFGRIDGEDNLIKDAPRGAILNARIMWSFSAASYFLKDTDYLCIASRAKDYILTHFFDEENKGTYWCLTSEGEPLDTKKQIYSQAFFIYAFSEYFIATGDETCRQKAIELFRLIEEHSFDREQNGYFEAYNRRWNLLKDLRLSEKDANEKKTMNTHLHILEAYTNLYRIWPDESLARQLGNLIEIFTDRIVDQAGGHLNLFFDENWQCKSTMKSYGHDIEASWLLYEAATVLNNDALTEKVKPVAVRIATAAAEGLRADGSMIYEDDDANSHYDHDRHWWVQAETVVGCLNTWALTGEKIWYERAVKSFEFIKNRLVDRRNGEWFWSIREDGTVNTADDKAGFWKCPYHNTRMCLEMMRRMQ